jgi:hypothetical protein
VPGSSARQDDKQVATLFCLSQEIETSLSPALAQMATSADRFDLFRLDSMLRDVLNAFIIPIQINLEHLTSLSWDCEKNNPQHGIYLYIVTLHGYDGQVITSEVRKLVLLR